MPSLRPRDNLFIRTAIRLAVTTLILALGLRTWLVMGLIEPVVVAGSSMMPTLQEGERLWIDRTALLWRHPERWEVVVSRNLFDASELCIKRVVGLPGECVSLRDGNVLVDGAVVVKSLDEQHALRQSVHRETDEEASDRRWQPDEMARWHLCESGWRHHAQQNDGISWLHYQHPQLITDNVPSNAELTRRLNLVDEFMLAAKFRVQGAGLISLAVDDGTSTAQVDIRLPDGEMTTIESRRQSSVVQLSEQSLARLTRGQVLIEFSNFDDQLLLAINGRVELRRPWPKTQAAGTALPFSIGALGLEVWLDELSIFRDTYHSRHAIGVPPPWPARWQLGTDEFFLLGDNAPVAVDSRLWGPVSKRMFVGKPLLP